MILIATRAAIALALATLGVVPAYADVLEVSGGEARWVAGPGASDALGVAEAAIPQSAPLAEVPAEVALTADYAAARPASAAAPIPAAYSAKVAEVATRFDLSPALIEALVWQESRWREGARSSAGARGLAQLMPGTARYLGVNPDDPFANLEGGARYLREQIDRFDGDLEKALAAYNAGPGRVITAGGVPAIRETRQYVSAIMGRLSDQSRSSE
ncbi:transglycosylase [Altererythrobacter sp. B11]|uniref:lytic transglycosylase domain-containing protein n=1 Tax=Altererythrobacter sp. B11 TaxID=2060312 RepID=UPI000DC6D8B8|nr:lytic transglycosylase domain-containing protein [Altererythrobacter sp. B11]BBC71956.1 transglycosylase [Altererythrobacter sp. B11]